MAACSETDLECYSWKEGYIYILSKAEMMAGARIAFRRLMHCTVRLPAMRQLGEPPYLLGEGTRFGDFKAGWGAVDPLSFFSSFFFR